MRTFNIGPCYEIGVIKNRIKEAILDGEIENSALEAKALMLKCGKELGLTAIQTSNK